MADMGYTLIELCSPQGYKTIGFGFLANMSTADIRKTINDAGLTCPSCHFGFAEVTDKVDESIDFAKAMGLTQMICSTFWLPKGATINDYLAAADKLNKGAEKIKGYSASDIIGKNFRLFYRKEDQERKLPEMLIQEATEKGKASHEGWRVRKDGTTFWGNIVITALHDEVGNLIGFSKVTRNLTERKMAEDTLREYTTRIEKHNEELQRINKDLDSFTYMASHDLQEPLRKIRTFCNMILSKWGENFPADISGYFERIIASVTRMQTLIDALLTYSRTTSKDVVLVPTDINNIIEEAKKDLSEVIAEKQVTIKADELPVLKVQPLQFQQLFFNLIENAIKYSRPGVPPEIKISSKKFWREDGETRSLFYRITVRDNGIGFEQQYADSIFKLFQRLHGRSEYSGTGIGLAICKEIVGNHKGTITAKSEPGKGSTFIIELPA